jgi:hypothetical protein
MSPLKNSARAPFREWELAEIVESEIWVELVKAMRQLGADPEQAVRALWDRETIYQVFEQLGATSNLLGIVSAYENTQPNEWVLDQLRRWNAGGR